MAGAERVMDRKVRGGAVRGLALVALLLVALGATWLARDRARSGVPQADASPSRGGSNPAARVTLSVRGAGGVALEGCRILAFGPGPARELGRTDAAGEWSAAAREIAGRPLAFRHPTHAQAERLVPDDPPPTLEVGLEPGAHLRGIVRRSDGSPVGPGAVVVAHAAHQAPLPDEEAFATDADPALHLARTEADGYFEIGSLVAGRAYLVSAGASGLLTLRSISIEAPSDELQLEVLPLFGCFVRLWDEEGGPPRTAAHLAAPDATATSSLDPAAKSPLQRRVDFLAAGIPLAQALDGPYEHALLFCADADVEALKPMMRRFVVPGYHPLTAGLRLPRVRGALAVNALALTREGGGWTELVVRLAGAPPIEVASEEPARAVELGLERADGRRYDLRLWALGPEGEVAHLVPAGSYTASLGGPGLALLPRTPPVRAELRGPRDRIELAWPAGAGAVEVRVRDPLGLELDGPFALHLLEDGALPVLESWSFERSPAVIPALRSGTWHAVVTRGRAGSPPPDAATAAFEVRPGALTPVELRTGAP